MGLYKVVITDFADADNDLEAAELQASGLDIELCRLNITDSEAVIPHVRDADALIILWCQINRRVIESLERCKVISRYGVGVDMIDLAAAAEHGIPVANTPDFCIEEVSTHTLGFILDLNRHIWLHHRHVSSGHWGNPPGGPPARLLGQTLGIVGLGNIGSAVARKANCLGLQVLGFDPYLSPDRLAALGVTPVELPELLGRSDYVSLHCPLTAETRHLIGAPQLAMMKPTAYLINMARGAVVDQPALCHALELHAIAGAALDVLEQEPPAPDDPLLRQDNVIITPHAASWSSDSRIQLRRDAARNVVAVLRGGLPRSIVNRAQLALLQGIQIPS